MLTSLRDTIALVISLCMASAVAQDDHPARRPDYPVGEYPPKSNEDHVWLHIDGPYIKRSPTCTEPNAKWQGCAASPTVMMQFNGPLLDWLASHEGVNWLRLSWFPPGYKYANEQPMCPDEWTTFGHIFENFIKPVVARCRQNKMYTLICCHIAQPGENIWEYDPANDPPYVEADVVKWIDWWKQIATEFKDEPWVMGYEILNEPQNHNGLRPNDIMREWVQRCVKAIREIDTTHIIVVPGVLSASINGNYFLWETNGLEWRVESELPDEQRYDFCDKYRQTAIRYHSYMDYLIEGTNRIPSPYEPTKYSGNINHQLGRFKDELNLCVLNTEMGYWLGPEEWFAPGTAIAEAKHWNWCRWYMMQSIALMVGDRDFWKDSPVKANYYTGVVSTSTPGYRNYVAFNSCMGEPFDVAFEAHPPCDTCIPLSDNIAWSWHGGFWTSTTESEWGWGFKWTDIWGWAAKKAGSRPPERHADPYRQQDVAISEAAADNLPNSAIHSRGRIVYMPGKTAVKLWAIKVFSLNGQLVYKTNITENSFLIPRTLKGAYVIHASDNALKTNSIARKVLIKE